MHGDISILIHRPHIPRLQPPITQCFFAGIGVFPISWHDQITTHHYFADFTDGQNISVFVPDLDLNRGLGTAN